MVSCSWLLSPSILFFKAHTCCSMYPYFILFLWLNNIPLYKYNTLFNVFIDEGMMVIWGCFYFLAIVNSISMNICVYAFVWMYVLISLGYLGVGLLGHMVALSNLLRKYQTVFQSIFTIVHAHQHLWNFQFLYLCQHLLLSDILMLAILVGVKLYLTMYFFLSSFIEI